MARVRALFITATLNTGGAERQWASLVPMLRERGLKPSVLTLLGRGYFFDEFVARGENVVCAELRSRLDLRGIRHVVATERGIDIVVSQSFAGQVVGHLVARRANVPHVTAEHLPPMLGRRLHERVALRALARGIDLTIGVTPTQIPDLVAAGYRRSAIRIIPNGVAELAPERPATAVRAELGLEEDAFVAVLAATLRPQKQAQVFIEAVVRAHRVNKRIVGLIVGSGPELAHIESLAAATNGAIHTLGERADVVDLLAMADAVCLSSKAEALPMVVLEAMALGRPIVATAVGGVPHALDGGTAGVLVAPGDADEFATALVMLAKDPARGALLGRRAHRRWSERFSADRMADAYAEILELTASNRRSSIRPSASLRRG